MPGGLRQAGWETLFLALLVASSCLSSVHALRYQDLGECPAVLHRRRQLPCHRVH